MKKSIVFDEPIIYISLALIVLSFGTWISYVIDSAIPLLVMGVPLGWMLRNVAGEEMIKGKKWFMVVIGASVALGVVGMVGSWKFLTLTGAFMVILVSCSMYNWKTTYKKKAGK